MRFLEDAAKSWVVPLAEDWEDWYDTENRHDRSLVAGTECLASAVSTTGVDGTCGPCDYEGDPSGASLDCLVCYEDAWLATGTEEPSPVPGFMQCSPEVSVLTGVPIGVGAAQSGQPCGEGGRGSVVLDDESTWTMRVVAGSGCRPCPEQPVRIGVTLGDDLVPYTTPEAGDPFACLGLDLTKRKWFIQDEQRSVRALLDYRGVVVEGYEYDPYGNVLVLKPGSSGIVEFTSSDVQVGINSASSPFLYTGRRYDEESGLMQYRTRYYSIEMGRFISKDTIGVWGDERSLGNGFAYGADGPHMAGDPSGQASLAFSILILPVKDNLPARACVELVGIVQQGINAISDNLGYQLQAHIDCVGEAGGVDLGKGGTKDSCITARAAGELSGYGGVQYTYGLGYMRVGDANGCAKSGSAPGLSIAEKRDGGKNWEETVIAAHELSHLFGAKDIGKGWRGLKGCWKQADQRGLMNYCDAAKGWTTYDSKNRDIVNAFFGCGSGHDW